MGTGVSPPPSSPDDAHDVLVSALPQDETLAADQDIHFTTLAPYEAMVVEGKCSFKTEQRTS